MTDAVNLNDAVRFYRESMQLLQREGVPFMVGGAFSMALYTGIARNTKDFDLLVRAVDVDLTLEQRPVRSRRLLVCPRADSRSAGCIDEGLRA